jgi:hypothetical protein
MGRWHPRRPDRVGWTLLALATLWCIKGVLFDVPEAFEADLFLSFLIAGLWILGIWGGVAHRLRQRGPGV